MHSRQNEPLTNFQLLTVKEAAKLLGRSRNSVLALIKSGELRHLRDGPRLIKIRLIDLHEYINRRLEGGSK